MIDNNDESIKSRSPSRLSSPTLLHQRVPNYKLPAAPPRALPRVELMISAFPSRPKYSSVPLNIGRVWISFKTSWIFL